MSRTSTMTIGFLLVFIGFQLNFVETFVLTPSATQFWVERFEPIETAYPNNQFQPNYSANNYQYSQQQQPFRNVGFSNTFQTPRVVQAKQITPPSWVCWPLIFLGAVFVLHGAAVHRGS